MRGTGRFYPGQHSVCGITPARAGNSPTWGAHQRIREDHPRACGEQGYALSKRGTCWGSPPRVRGTVLKMQCLKLWERITPARAGNRGYLEGCSGPSWDHPRACGEQGFGFRLVFGLVGSPPRVRGTAPGQIVKSSYTGITPARAGNSNWYHLIPIDCRDHPRACGEQYITGGSATCTKGSPPRVRGTAKK